MQPKFPNLIIVFFFPKPNLINFLEVKKLGAISINWKTRSR